MRFPRSKSPPSRQRRHRSGFAMRMIATAVHTRKSGYGPMPLDQATRQPPPFSIYRNRRLHRGKASATANDRSIPWTSGCHARYTDTNGTQNDSRKLLQTRSHSSLLHTATFPHSPFHSLCATDAATRPACTRPSMSHCFTPAAGAFPRLPYGRGAASADMRLRHVNKLSSLPWQNSPHATLQHSNAVFRPIQAFILRPNDKINDIKPIDRRFHGPRR